MHYVYVLKAQSITDGFYIGCTGDLKRRLAEHHAGQVKSTRNRTWKLVYYEAYLTYSAARKREYHLKQDGRARCYLMKRIVESLE
jgi:putative endonuclease